jgi:D-alanyl-D-alanine carboxypeptidase/D-alanyl-D-alanine-endopeptidase (penicillin-binding protein 4)
MGRITSYFWLVIVVLSLACGPVSRARKTLKRSPVLNRHFTGFALYDPSTGKTLAEQNADKYFTPASNTKLFTLYTALKVLGDSVPALKYATGGDTLFFRGTGDPSLLHPDFRNNDVYNFLKGRSEKLVYVRERSPVPHFGPGWGWDDYNDYYSAEMAALPVYGNVVRFSRGDSGILWAHPGYFRSGVTTGQPGLRRSATFIRNLEHNRFTYYPGQTPEVFTQDVPFRYSVPLAAQLLGDTLQREVGWTDYRPLPNGQVLYGTAADSLYRKLMQESDNFIAEQLLLMCSGQLFDSLSTESAISYARQTLLADLPDPPVWVDGSGLSRYNLFTPRTIVALLLKIYRQVPQERLFGMLPAGGRSGTLRNWYGAEPPFVFAKTGSLSNVHCLSGYVVTRKGKVLLFSFMHNNYTGPLNDIRREMDKVLRTIARRE